MANDYEKKGGHGGARPGAGRKPADNRIAEAYRERFAILPIDYMLSVINGVNPATGEPFTDETRPDDERLDRLAIAAAPYIQRRLAPVDVKDSEDSEPRKVYGVDVRRLTTEELRWYERILMKAEVPASQLPDAPR